MGGAPWYFPHQPVPRGAESTLGMAASAPEEPQQREGSPHVSHRWRGCSGRPGGPLPCTRARGSPPKRTARSAQQTPPPGSLQVPGTHAPRPRPPRRRSTTPALPQAADDAGSRGPGGGVSGGGGGVTRRPSPHLGTCQPPRGRVCGGVPGPVWWQQ